MKSIKHIIFFLFIIFLKFSFAESSFDPNEVINIFTNQNSNNTCEPIQGQNNDMYWKNAGFQNVKITNMSSVYTKSDRTKFTHEFPLTIVLIRGSGFTLKTVQERIRKTAAVFKNCGIKIQNPNIIEVDPPNGWLDFTKNINDLRDLQLSKMIPQTVKRPILYYFRSNKSKEDIQNKKIVEAAHSFIPMNDEPTTLSNTAWISNEVLEEEYINSRNKKYSTEAHELGHILRNCYCHVEPIVDNDKREYNFMSESPYFSDDTITPAQCEEMKKSTLVKTI